MPKYLKETALLDYSHSSIQSIVNSRGWKSLGEKEKIKQVYLFVRDEILFGYNEKDEMKASEILKDGYGQCNTKSILLMALLRAINIPCRLHGFLIDKSLQKGIVSGIWYKLAPKNIIHSWVEVCYKDNWYALEGVILDKKYLTRLQNKFKDRAGIFCGYGVCADNFQNPNIEWKENNTYIQRLGISRDFGVFDSPDEFFKKYQQKFFVLEKFIYKKFVRKIMNKKVKEIRST